MTFPYLSYVFHLITYPAVAGLPAGKFGAGADMEFVRSVLSARLFSALMSTATVYVVYRIALRAYGSRAGLFAALCAALSCLLVQLGHFGTPDATTGFLLTVTLLSAIWAADKPSSRSFALAGLFCGIATGSEYHMALLIIPIVAAWSLARERSFVWLPLVAGAALAGYLVTNAYSVLDFSSWLAAMEHTLSIRTVDSAAEYGSRWSVYGSPWLYVVRYALGYGVGLPLAVWFVAGAIWAAVKRERTDIILLCWLVPYFVLVSLSPAKFMRYSAPLLPVLVVLAGRLASDILAARVPGVRISAAILAAVALLYSAVYDAAYVGLFASPDPRYVASQWLATHVPAHTYVAYEQLPNGLVNMPYFGTQHGFPPCFTQFNPKDLDGAQHYLVTDNYDLEEHPRFSDSLVSQFRRALTSTSTYTEVKTVHYTPSFLGVTFSIDGSPHDWRYPAHDLTIYAAQSKPKNSSSDCFPTLQAAHDALYTGSAPT